MDFSTGDMEDDLHENPSDAEITAILESAKTIAVVGLSPDPSRPSYGVAKALQSWGYRIIPVNPNLSGPVLEENPYASLKEIEDELDIVDVFRRSEQTESVAREAVEIGADVLWMQLGVVNEEAAEAAGGGGLTVVMDRCIAIEYGRLM